MSDDVASMYSCGSSWRLRVAPQGRTRPSIDERQTARNGAKTVTRPSRLLDTPRRTRYASYTMVRLEVIAGSIAAGAADCSAYRPRGDYHAASAGLPSSASQLRRS